MEEEIRRKRFEDCRVRFMEEVNPRELIIYMTCLTKSLEEEVRCWQDREGARHAAFRFSMELVKKDDWYHDVIQALCKINNKSLADAIEGRQDESSDGEPAPGPGPDDGGDDDRPVRTTGLKDGDSNTEAPSAADTSNGPVSSSRPKGPSVSPKLRTRQSKSAPQITVNTLFRKLPARVNEVLERLNNEMRYNWKELLYRIEPWITTEEMTRIANTPNPTQELCNRLLQSEEVTLQVLLEHLYNMGRMDIVTDLLEQLNISWTPPDEELVDSPSQGAEKAESRDHGNNTLETSNKVEEVDVTKASSQPLHSNKKQDVSAADLQRYEQNGSDSSQNENWKSDQACAPGNAKDKFEASKTEPEACISTSSSDKGEDSFVAPNVNDSLAEKVFDKNDPNLRKPQNYLGSVIDNSGSNIDSSNIVKSEESKDTENEDGDSSEESRINNTDNNGSDIRSIKDAKSKESIDVKNEVGNLNKENRHSARSSNKNKVFVAVPGNVIDNQAPCVSPVQFSVRNQNVNGHLYTGLHDPPSSLRSGMGDADLGAAVKGNSDNKPQELELNPSNVNSTWARDRETKNNLSGSLGGKSLTTPDVAIAVGQGSAATPDVTKPSGQSSPATPVVTKPSGQSSHATPVVTKGSGQRSASAPSAAGGNDTLADRQEGNDRQNTMEEIMKAAQQNSPSEARAKLEEVQLKRVQSDNGFEKFPHSLNINMPQCDVCISSESTSEDTFQESDSAKQPITENCVKKQEVVVQPVIHDNQLLAVAGEQKSAQDHSSNQTSPILQEAGGMHTSGGNSTANDHHEDEDENLEQHNTVESSGRRWMLNVVQFVSDLSSNIGNTQVWHQ
ncbi:uncharacterized protein [Amphiura filiformis]|uniref:uncharacterized protein isoform X2 n=1 Tax=Amphiura filiformis TaxID=82378 RepID=UPI003B20C210